MILNLFNVAFSLSKQNDAEFGHRFAKWWALEPERAKFNKNVRILICPDLSRSYQGVQDLSATCLGVQDLSTTFPGRKVLLVSDVFLSPEFTFVISVNQV